MFIKDMNNMQSWAGVQSDKNMASKLMYSPNDDIQNYPFCRLKLEVETFKKNLT